GRDRTRPGKGLRRTKGLDPGRSGEVALPQPRLRPRGRAEEHRSFRSPAGRDLVCTLRTNGTEARRILTQKRQRGYCLLRSVVSPTSTRIGRATLPIPAVTPEYSSGA